MMQMLSPEERRQHRSEATARYRRRYPERARESSRRSQAKGRKNNPEIGRQRRREYYRKNRDKVLKYQREYTALNYDRLKQGWLDYGAKHREEVRARATAWQRSNPERVKATSRQRRESGYYKQPERKAKAQEWVNKNREKVRDTLRASRHKRRAQGGPSFTSADWRAIVAYWDGRCAYCGLALPLVVEHANPLSRGGTNAKENILPACAPCNREKQTQTENEYRLTRLLTEPFDVPYVVDGVAVPRTIDADNPFVLVCIAAGN